MKATVLKIIEAGVEKDTKKLISYAELLAKLSYEDKRFQRAIRDRLSGEYKKQPKVITNDT